MRLKRKVALLALGLCLTTAVVGCGDSSSSNDDSATTTAVSSEENDGNTSEDGDTSADSTTEYDVPEVPEYTAKDYVTLGDYKGIKVTQDSTEVTDEEVEDQIQTELQYASSTEEITDRKEVQEGDIANIDYVGKKDDVEFDGGTATGYNLTIGSDTFIDGFEDGLIGVEVGETVDLNLTFPEDYNNEELAGQDVVFTVTVNGIYKDTVPELNEEYVKENTDYDSVEEYKAQVKEDLIAEKKETAEANVRSNIWTMVVDNATVTEYPENSVENQWGTMMNYYASMASYYGMTLEDLASQYGMTQEEFEDQITTDAQNYVKQLMVMECILNAENISLSDDDYEKGVKEYAEQYNMEEDEFIETYGEDEIRSSLLNDKGLDFLVENAKVN